MCNDYEQHVRWADFLDFLVGQAKRYKQFKLMMQTEAIGLIEENGRVVGVRTRTKKKGEGEIRAKLVIGSDGRSSVIREAAGLKVEDIGAPMDVLWMRLPRQESDPPQTLGRVKAGAIFIMLNRNDYWQCGYVIKKGGFDDLKSAGMDAFRSKLLELAPFLADRVGELKDWDEIKLLTVKVDRLKRWYRHGLLCIGDAAHAMSPIAGVGINLAIQDAVATANLLWKPLAEGTLCDDDLAKVQRRRSYPTRMTQGMQVFLQNHAVSPTLDSKQLVTPGPLKLFNAMPLLRGIPASIMGIGFRAEHILCPDLGEKV